MPTYMERATMALQLFQLLLERLIPAPVINRRTDRHGKTPRTWS